MDPTTYCPKPVRNEIVWGYLDDDVRHSKKQWKKIQDFMKKKPPFLCSMLVYAVHQCCGKDRLSLCETLLDACSDELRKVVCNAPFGKNQYTPLHRCAFNGSERMLRMLCACGADITLASPENETLLEVLEQGLLHEEKSCVYTMADVLHFDAKTRFYTVRMPNQTTQTFSSALVDHRKYMEDGKVYVYTPETKDNMIFIRERFDGCRMYIVREQQRRRKPSTSRIEAPKKRRVLGKRIAARIIQEAFREYCKKSKTHKSP